MAGAGGWAGGGGHAGGHVRLLRLRNAVSAGEGTALLEVRAGPRSSGVATAALPLPAPAPPGAGNTGQRSRPRRDGGRGSSGPPARSRKALPCSRTPFRQLLVFTSPGQDPGCLSGLAPLFFLSGITWERPVSLPSPCPPFPRAKRGEPVPRARSTGTLRVCPGWETGRTLLPAVDP